jgi:adenylate cyclase
MGSRVRMNYTMMGDAVNLAARLESASKQYGVFTMISNFTWEMVKDRFVTRQLDKVTVVGKSEPVVLYELIGDKASVDEPVKKLLTLYHEGLSCYYAQDWDTAIKILEEADLLEPNRLITKGNITPSRKIINDCNYLKLHPPGPDWDGVSSLTSK